MYSLIPSSSSSSSSSSFSSTSPPPSRASPPYNSGVGGGWGPYSSSKEFDINMASILIILVLATFLAFVLHAAIRFLLRLYRRRLQSPTAPSPNSLQKRNRDSAPSIDDGLPTLVFSAGTKLAGGAEVAECAICLSEFVEGDGVRVLPACNHGFHVKCVEGWLASKSSCPTCRTSCRPAAAAEP